MALRRWKPFFAAFGPIDAAIEAATGGGSSRDKYRQARSDLVELLCDAADDDARAEALCRLLDRAMAEALLTLRAVPVPVTAAVLAATDVAAAVRGLLKHDAGMVRAHARGVLAQWTASVEAEAASAEAQHAALGTLLQALREHEVAAAAVAGGGCVGGGSETAVVRADDKQDAKMSGVECAKNKQAGDAKRKREHPGEADDVKRRCKGPEVVEHRPRKVEPDRKRSTDDRRCSTSTRHRHRRV